MEVGSPTWLQGLDGMTQTLQENLSLEGTVLQQRAKELRAESLKLARQRAFLREERRRARMEEEALRQDREALNFVKKDDWVPIAYLPGPATKRIRINVGGQVFEASEGVLRREPGSMLSALCDDECPLRSDDDGIVYVDRDWWVFRFVLKFLRDGVLPEDRRLLAQMYREAAYWRCSSLMRAIEQVHLQLFRHDGVAAAAPGEGKQSAPKNSKESWWRDMPNWWQDQSKSCTLSSDERQAYELFKKEEEKRKEHCAPDDWWVSDEYNGRKFSLDKDLELVRKYNGDKSDDTMAQAPALNSTWSYSANRRPPSTLEY